MNIRRLMSLGAALLMAACGTSREPEITSRLRPARARASVDVGEITGQITPVDLGGSAGGPQFFTVQLNPVKDGQATNPVNTIEVYSTANLVTATAGSPCAGTASIWAPVVIKNFLTEALVNVQVEMTRITPSTNKLCTPLPANRDPALDTTYGIIDYGGTPAAPIGDYSLVRTGTPTAISANGQSASMVWAFTLPNSDPFTWAARVVADLRPYPAAVESPYVDYATAGTPNPQITVISDDQQAAGSVSPPSIVNGVHIWSWLDSGMGTSAGDVDQVAVVSINDPATWGLGTRGIAAATAANLGRTIYLQMQNQWQDTNGSTVLGQKVGPGADPLRTFKVTTPATVPALMPGIGSNVSGSKLAAFTASPEAIALNAGADIEIYAQFLVRAPSTYAPCSSRQGALRYTGAQVAVPGPFNLNLVPSGTLVAGTKYCYRVRNGYFTSLLGAYYSGSWSTYSDFVF